VSKKGHAASRFVSKRQGGGEEGFPPGGGERKAAVCKKRGKGRSKGRGGGGETCSVEGGDLSGGKGMLVRV